MPYFVFKITQPTQLVKNLTLQDSFDAYKEARALARQLRMAAANSDSGEQVTYKLVFAANQLEAEENLQEKREKPILMEWEK